MFNILKASCDCTGAGNIPVRKKIPSVSGMWMTKGKLLPLPKGKKIIKFKI